MQDIKNNYIVPALEHFNGGPAQEVFFILHVSPNHYDCHQVEFASLSCSSSFSIVAFRASDCMPDPPATCLGTYTSIKKVITVFDKLRFIGGRGDTMSSGQEGIAAALEVFSDLEEERPKGLVTTKHILYVCNSPCYDMPIIENVSYMGKTLDELAAIVVERKVNVSFFTPRKLPFFYKLYEKCGGDLLAAKEKNYAKEPRHLVLLRGFALQERPLTPKPVPSNNFRPVAPGGQPPEKKPALNTPATGPGYPGVPGGQQSQVGPGGQLQPKPVLEDLLKRDRPRPPGQDTLKGLLDRPPIVSMGPNGPPLRMNPNMPQGMNPGMNPMNPGMGPGNMQSQQQQHNPGMQQPQPNSMQQQHQNQQNMPQPNMNNQQVGMQQRMPQTGGMMPGQQAMQTQQQGMGQPGPGGMNQQQGMQPGMQPGMSQQQQGMGPRGPAPPGGQREREVIWKGELEWQEKVKDGPGDQKISHSVACSVSTSKENGVPEVKPDNWPPKLIMQLIPKTLVQTIGGEYFRNSKSVLFHPNDCESLEALTKVMGTGFAGCVHFTGHCDIKVLILLYSNDKKAYLGFIPNDQTSFVERIRTVIQRQKMGQQQQQPQPGQRSMGPGGPGGGMQMGMQMQQGQAMMGGQMMMGQQGQVMSNQSGMMGQRMMGPGGGVSMGGQQIIRGGPGMGGQAQYVRMAGGQGGMVGGQRMMGQQMTPGLRQILQQQPGMQQRPGGPMQMGMQGQGMMGGQMMMSQQGQVMAGQGGMMPQGGGAGQGGIMQQQQGQQQNASDPMLRELLN